MSCEKCQSLAQLAETGTRELYSWSDGHDFFVWDVTTAKEVLKQKPRPALPLPPEIIQMYLEVNKPVAEHLDHIPEAERDVPGIMVLWPDKSLTLIDGTHRAARALRDGTPYKVYVLNVMESIYCQARAQHADPTEI
jgi:hypothetical protein